METTISDLVHIKLLIFWSVIMVLKLVLEEYIDVFYNLKRSHYSLGLMTPNGKELAFYEH